MKGNLFVCFFFFFFLKQDKIAYVLSQIVDRLNVLTHFSFALYILQIKIYHMSIYDGLFIYLFQKIEIIEDINLAFNKINEQVTCFYLWNI